MAKGITVSGIIQPQKVWGAIAKTVFVEGCNVKLYSYRT
jgi:hypothetical protein